MQLIFGLVTIAIFAYGFWGMYHSLSQLGFPGGPISYFSLFKQYHTTLLMCLFAMTSGVLLLKSKKAGWLLSISYWLTLGVQLVLIDWSVYHEQARPTGSPVLLVSVVFIALFWSFAILLTTQTFRIKYTPTLIHWLAIVGIVVLVVMERFLFLQIGY